MRKRFDRSLELDGKKREELVKMQAGLSSDLAASEAALRSYKNADPIFQEITKVPTYSRTFFPRRANVYGLCYRWP